MRPCSVEARSMLQESDNLGQPFDRLLARDKRAVSSHNDRRDATSAGAGGDNTVIAGNALARHARAGIGSFPVITKGGFLDHGQQFVVAKSAGGGSGC